MKNLLKATCAGLLVSLFAAAPAFADVSDIRASDRAIEFDVGATDLKYGESPASTSPYAHDTETGWLPSVNLGLGWLTQPGNSPLSDLYVRVDGGVTFGSTNYTGGLQNATTHAVTPYDSTTNDTIWHLSGKVGHAFTLSDMVMLTPLVDLGFRSWQRQLTGTGAYTERYESGEAMGGLLLQVSPMPRLVLSAMGEAGTTFSSQMETGGTNYDLGSKTIWQVEGKAGYALTQRTELTGTVQLTGFGFDASPVLANGSYEPNSYTHELALLAGFAYHL